MKVKKRSLTLKRSFNLLKYTGKSLSLIVTPSCVQTNISPILDRLSKPNQRQNYSLRIYLQSSDDGENSFEQRGLRLKIEIDLYRLKSG